MMLLGALGLVAAGLGFGAARIFRAPAQMPEIAGFLWPGPKAVGSFSLDGAGGAPVDLARLEGHWNFLFFGYTYCPDVCPTTLATMHQVMEALRSTTAGEGVQTVFVSVDPGRDSLQRLRDYVAFFDPAFIAATASDQRLAEFTRKLGVLYRRGESNDAGGYEVDHSASILLIDPGGRLVGIFSAPHDPGDIARRFRKMREHVEASS